MARTIGDVVLAVDNISLSFGGVKALSENDDVREFYLGVSKEGRRSFRDAKSYRRRKRWLS